MTHPPEMGAVTHQESAPHRLRVLVVDDDDVDRMAVRRALKGSGLAVEIEEAADAVTALAALTRGTFDCALLDYQLPGQDGLQLLRATRAAGVGTPIIMLTGYGDEQLAVELMKAGASDYLPKSALGPERLGQSLRSALRVAQAEIQARQAQDALRAYAAQLRSLADAAVRINSTLAIPVMLDVAAGEARSIIGAERAAVRLLDDRERGDGTADTCSSVGASAGESALPCAETAPGEGTTLAAPLIGLDAVPLGVLQLWGKAAGQFTDADESILIQLAQVTAVGIENARLYRAAQEATRVRDDVLAIVSHDLRNPIHTIQLATSFLLETAPAAEEWTVAKRQLAIVQRAAVRANRLIEDLLDMTRIEAGRLVLERGPADPAALIAEAVDAAAPLAEAARIELRGEIADGLPTVLADRERVLQVFANLIGNALKFTPPAGSIVVVATAADDVVRFSVIDTGPGISAAHLPHLFDRFWQARSSAKLGAGLGLSIAKGIVDGHGGRIWVASEEGHGAAFVFTLPTAIAAGPAADLMPSSAATRGSS